MMANVADDGGPALAADRAELVEALVNHSVTLMVEMTRQAGGGDARYTHFTRVFLAAIGPFSHRRYCHFDSK